MSKYKDKELNRLLSESDDILADLNLNQYETPEEERARKAREAEARRLEEERLLQEELNRRERERREQEQKKSDQEGPDQDERCLHKEIRTREEQQENHRSRHKDKQSDRRQERSQDLSEDIQAIMQENAVEARQKDGAGETVLQEEAEGPTLQEEKTLQEETENVEEAAFQAEVGEAIQEGTEKAEEVEKSEAREGVGELLQEGTEKAEETVLQEGTENVEETSHQEKEEAAMSRPSFELGGMIFLILSFMYMEVITHIGVYHSMSTDFIFPLFCAVSVGCLVRMLSGFMGPKGNTVVVIICELLYACYCNMQMACHAVTGTYLHISHVGEDMDAFLNNEQLSSGTSSVLLWMVLMFLPIIIWAVVGRKWITFSKIHVLTQIVIALGMIIFAVLGIVMLDTKGYEDAAPYTAFYSYDSESRSEQAGDQLGMTGLTVLELMDGIRK